MKFLNARLSGHSALLSAAMLCAPLAVQAQQVDPMLETNTPVATTARTLAIASISVPQSTRAVLRAGTPVPLVLLEELTIKKKKVKINDRVRLEVAENIEVNGVVVVPAGSPGVGEITFVKNKGMWGKSGKLEGRVLYIRVNGRQIRMSGSFDDKGVTGTGAVVGSIALLPVAGFFVTGTSAVLPKGGVVNGFIDEDVPLDIEQAAPEPMRVQAAPEPMSVPVTAQGEPAQMDDDIMEETATLPE